MTTKQRICDGIVVLDIDRLSTRTHQILTAAQCGVAATFKARWSRGAVVFQVMSRKLITVPLVLLEIAGWARTSLEVRPKCRRSVVVQWSCKALAITRHANFKTRPQSRMGTKWPIRLQNALAVHSRRASAPLESGAGQDETDRGRTVESRTEG